MKPRSSPRLLTPLLLLLLPACGASSAPYRTPAHWEKSGYGWPGAEPARADEGSGFPGSSLASASATSTAAFFPVGEIGPEPKPVALASGRCLENLRSTSLKFAPLEELRGVEAPIEVKSSLAGVAFYANDGRGLRMDCRLAMALDELAPTFAELKVTRVRFSGAYSYRTTRSGRLSHHAHGLAIDLHDFVIDGRILSVSGDYEKNAGCGPSAPVLNQLACKMKARVSFQEFLTPDDNRDHRDHLHVAVARRDQL